MLVAAGAVTLLYFSYDPTPAGANPSEAVANLDQMSAAFSANSAMESSQDTGAALNEGELRGRMAILMQILLLEKGLEQVKDVPNYSATFHKKERIGGKLSDDQFMTLKLRHEPFSVYMKWLKGNDEGQEILYVEGENDNEMLVKVGGVSGRMLPAIKLDPTGSIAMGKARYPITTLGFAEMIEQILEFRRSDLTNIENVKCRMLEGQKFDRRECYCFILEYSSPQHSELFRKSVIYVDNQHSIPICIKNFGWPTESQQELEAQQLDDETLSEFYSFSNISFDSKLVANDFDKSNENYHFRR